VWCGVGGCGKERGGIGVGVGEEIDVRRSNCLGLGLKFNPYFEKGGVCG
jgi:hypothetical protein